MGVIFFGNMLSSFNDYQRHPDALRHGGVFATSLTVDLTVESNSIRLPKINHAISSNQYKLISIININFSKIIYRIRYINYK